MTESRKEEKNVIEYCRKQIYFCRTDELSRRQKRTKKAIRKRLSDCKGCGNGSYVLYKPSVAQIIAIVHGKEEVFDVKEEIRRIYGKKRVTQRLMELCMDSIKSGKKKVYYTEKEGLTIQ